MIPFSGSCCLLLALTLLRRREGSKLAADLEPGTLDDEWDVSGEYNASTFTRSGLAGRVSQRSQTTGIPISSKWSRVFMA